MVIRVTDKEIDLSGSPSELREIAAALEGLLCGQSCEFEADPNADPAPYDRVLSAFRVMVSAGPVRVTVTGSLLMAEGDADRMTSFASWFAFSEGARFPEHRHFEWFPGNLHIAEDSRPLGISVE